MTLSKEALMYANLYDAIKSKYKCNYCDTHKKKSSANKKDFMCAICGKKVSS